MPRRMSAVRVLLGVVLIIEIVLVAAAVHAGESQQRRVLIRESAAGLAFIAAVLLLRASRLTTRHAQWVVLGVAAALQIVAISGAPSTSDDAHRYIWDAKVQFAGTDPYRYAPPDPALAGLRDGYLFPDERPCRHLALPDGSCISINHPGAHTIYPPVAQAAFDVIRAASFGAGDVLPLQIAAGLGALIVTVLLARRNRPLWTVALWAWCPITAVELGNNAHIDWLAVLAVLVAVGAAGRGRWLLAGLLVGAGIATKLYPGLLLAPLMRRRPWRTAGAAIGLVALSYLPHVLAVGTGVLGYLPDYLREDGYDSGGRYRLLALVASERVASVLAVVVVACVLAWAWWQAPRRDLESLALVVVGCAVLVATPALPWYTLLLLALAAARGRPEWLGVVTAPSVIYLAVAVGAPGRATSSISYLIGAALLVTGTVWRRRSPPAASQQVRQDEQHDATRDRGEALEHSGTG